MRGQSKGGQIQEPVVINEWNERKVKRHERSSPIPVCSLCGQTGTGPLEASQDGKGYRHSWGCQNHKGQPCLYRTDVPICQEGLCIRCMIFLEYSEKTGG